MADHKSRKKQKATWRTSGNVPIAPERFKFRRVAQDPLIAISQRFALAIGLVLLVTVITYVGRAGYVDTQHPNGPFTFIDALYYSTVTITTTGYGDIVPSTQWARFVTTVVVTPLRVIFLILLVGTTLEVLASQSRFLFRLRNWQKDMHDHIVICGYGIKGQAALEYLRKHDDDCPAVAVDNSNDALEDANKDGISGILGSAYDSDILKAAEIKVAKTVIVALPTDEASVLTVLRARELNSKATIVASCREQENVELLKSSGADEVIVSSSSAGRILGMAAEAPEAARVVNDLLTFGDGLDINERACASPGEPLAREGETPIAIARGKKIMRPDADNALPLQIGDRVIFIQTQEDPDPDIIDSDQIDPTAEAERETPA